MPLQVHLVNFYRQYNPDMLEKRDDIDNIVRSYTGKEQELNERLQKKYGADLWNLWKGIVFNPCNASGDFLYYIPTLALFLSCLQSRKGRRERCTK